MGTVADKLTYLNTTKTNIKNAIINKGVSVSESDTFRSYADKIASIGSDAYKLVTDTTASAVKTLTTAPLPFNSLKVGIEAVQDLHGYDKPWVGGAGKNLFNKPNLVMNKAIPSGTTIYGQIFGVTASFKLYGYDEENNEYEVMALSINKNSTTTTRAYTRLEISQSAIDALGNGNLMVSLSDFTQFEPYENICPISGWDAVNLNISDADTSNPTTYTIQFTDGTNPLTVYGGTLDVVNGLLTINQLGINVMSQEKRGWQVGSKTVCYRITLPQTATSCATNQTHGTISNMMTEQLAYYGVSRPNDLDSINFAIDTSGVALAVYDTDLTLLEQQMMSKYTDLFIIYPLATPITIQLTPTMVRSLLGTTNLWADSGKIEEVGFFEEFNA